MAARKPLVVINGQLQQLPSGDTLDASVSELDVVSKQNDNAGSINKCAPVYATATGNVDLAQANASGTMEVIGLVADTSIGAGASGNIITNGVLTASTAQWDAVTGDTGGLDPGEIYFLGPSTAGMLTTTAPTTDGQFVVRVGKALSTTEMEICEGQPILL